MEDEFTEYHQDSFVFGKDDPKKPAPAGNKPPVQGLPKKPPQRPAGGPPRPPGEESEDKLDDFVPEKVGQVVDNVFGKLDNLVNDAADYLFGNKKKPGGLLEGDQFQRQKQPNQIPPLKPQPLQPLQPNLQTPAAQAAAAPEAPAQTQAPVAKPRAPQATTIKTLSTLQGSRAPEMIRPVMPESKPIKADGPIISRTTSISELEDLPLEILDDPDLPRYFDQMKLYEAKVVTGGLCNLPQYEASLILRRGRWKGEFGIRFEDLRNIDPGIYPMEMARSRFNGMRPTYKAQAHLFGGREGVMQAIVEDLNAYLKGKTGKHFHPFIYQVVTRAGK